MKKKIVISIIIYYLLAISIIALGFLFGNGYKKYSHHPSAFMSSYINSLYEWQELDKMFDGTIEKHSGWYGIHWKRIFSAYQISDEISDETLNFWNEDIDYNWSEKDFINYISDSKVYLFRDWDWIKLDNELLLIEYSFTNNVSLHDEAIPKIIVIFTAILLLPIFILMIIKIFRSTIKRKYNSIK